jgi:uncharacterized protein HemX
MAESSKPTGTSGSALLASALLGAVVGAAGFAWWLLDKAERRRQEQRQQRHLRLSRLQGGAHEFEPGGAPAASAASVPPGSDAQLRDRVHQLNQAIDEVRQQLEKMQPQP